MSGGSPSPKVSLRRRLVSSVFVLFVSFCPNQVPMRMRGSSEGGKLAALASLCSKVGSTESHPTGSCLGWRVGFTSPNARDKTSMWLEPSCR